MHPRGAAVIVADHEHAAPRWSRRRSSARLRLLTVGRKGEGIRLADSAIDGFAQVLEAHPWRARTTRVRLPLVGDFQVENALVAAGLAIATGSEPRARVRGARRA